MNNHNLKERQQQQLPLEFALLSAFILTVVIVVTIVCVYFNSF
jgi:uncharacterized protein (UPF0333 family)